MEILTGILGISPIVMTLVEIVKRFIPDSKRTVANPALALVIGLAMAFFGGGSQELMTTLTIGLGGAASAVAAYKIPKEVGKSLGIQ